MSKDLQVFRSSKDDSMSASQGACKMKAESVDYMGASMIEINEGAKA